VDAFNPLAGWYNPDVIGIDVGITMLMAENARSGFVWNVFMKNKGAQRAMEKAGFRATVVGASSSQFPVLSQGVPNQNQTAVCGNRETG
jgi:hypothetical protein